MFSPAAGLARATVTTYLTTGHITETESRAGAGRKKKMEVELEGRAETACCSAHTLGM